MEKQIIAFSLQRKVSTSQFENETSFVSISEELEPCSLEDALVRLDELRVEVRSRVDEEAAKAPRTQKPIQQPRPVEAPRPLPASPHEPTTSFDPDVITEPQAKRLTAIAWSKGWVFKTSDGPNYDDLNNFLKQSYGLKSAKDMLKKDYNEAVATLEKGPNIYFGR